MTEFELWKNIEQIAKCIEYKKATRIKLLELAKIADAMEDNAYDWKFCPICGTPKNGREK